MFLVMMVGQKITISRKLRMSSLLGDNGFERLRRACLKSCQVGTAGWITSMSIRPFPIMHVCCGAKPSSRKQMQGFFFKRACDDVSTIQSRGQLGSSLPLEGLVARGDCSHCNPTIGFQSQATSRGNVCEWFVSMNLFRWDLRKSLPITWQRINSYS